MIIEGSNRIHKPYQTGPSVDMAKKAKARTIIVKLLSTAGTGFFYTTRRPRTTAKLSFMKFDPRANQNVLFNEAKINRPN
ncbi:54S ribosomal protein L39, mitochondrial [Linnemannia zychae]|nr:54S ribosomal protein L39, mitochondrial [Linnemannia zychae]